MKQTTLCYIDNGDSYLMLHRVKKENDASHGKWIGVGGKCEADESPDECMLREVKEETGLDITAWRGEPDMSIDDEGTLAWIPKAGLMDLNLWEGDRIFLRLLLDSATPFFSLKLVYEHDEMASATLNGKEIK